MACTDFKLKTNSSRLVLVLKKSKTNMFKSDFSPTLLTAERDTREFSLSVTDWFLIFETWMRQRYAVKSIEESTKTRPVSLSSNVTVRGGVDTTRFQRSLWKFCKETSYNSNFRLSLMHVKKKKEKNKNMIESFTGLRTGRILRHCLVWIYTFVF